MSRWLLALVLTSAAAGSAHAQVARDRQEKAQDRREIAQDQRQIADDANDIRHLQILIGRFDRARATGNAVELQAVDNEVRRVVAIELQEGRREQAQKNAEVARSAGEVRSERREVGRDVRNGRPGAAARDRRDARDDRRDLRDDVRDAQKESAQNQRRYNIAVELNGLAGRLDPPSLERKRTLMVQLLREAGIEYRESVKEANEDRKELREDRRETREDRRRR